MPVVHFTANLQRHVPSPSVAVCGATVRECLCAVLELNPCVRSHVIDDQGAVRKHVNVFVDGEQVCDRVDLSDPVRPDSELYVMQALSRG